MCRSRCRTDGGARRRCDSVLKPSVVPGDRPGERRKWDAIRRLAATALGLARTADAEAAIYGPIVERTAISFET